LSYLLEVRATEPGEQNPRKIKSYRCQGYAPEKMTLDDWQAENYKAVTLAAGSNVGSRFAYPACAVSISVSMASACFHSMPGRPNQ
jgi:hypothetical protein